LQVGWALVVPWLVSSLSGCKRQRLGIATAEDPARRFRVPKGSWLNRSPALSSHETRHCRSLYGLSLMTLSLMIGLFL
jgi:hypothetical protein